MALDRRRFELFIERVSSRMPLSVAWEDEQAGGGAANSEGVPVAKRVLDMTAPPDASGARRRRMFIHIMYDSKASARQAWHIELRWLMCQGQQVEEIVKHCTRRARLAGLLLLQVPTDRRPRPFTPVAVVAVPTHLRPAAIAALCHHVGFVDECTAPAAKQRWMHELGVAFVGLDSRGFTWLPNRLLPSQAARVHSDKLLGRFREICKALEFSSLGLLPTPAAAEPAQPAHAACLEEDLGGEAGAGQGGGGGGGGGGTACRGGTGAPLQAEADGAGGARSAAAGVQAEPRLSTRTLSSSSSEEEKAAAPEDGTDGSASGTTEP